MASTMESKLCRLAAGLEPEGTAEGALGVGALVDTMNDRLPLDGAALLSSSTLGCTVTGATCTAVGATAGAGVVTTSTFFSTFSTLIPFLSARRICVVGGGCGKGFLSVSRL